jgi:hypothetical protein
MAKIRFITYTSDEEIIVTTPKTEKETIKSFFSDGGRDLDNYDRNEHQDFDIRISSKMSVRD